MTALVSQLERLFEKVWEEEVILEDWLKGWGGLIIVIGKKGALHIVATTGLLLRATASRLLQIILLRRMNAGMECPLRENEESLWV